MKQLIQEIRERWKEQLYYPAKKIPDKRTLIAKFVTDLCTIEHTVDEFIGLCDEALEEEEAYRG